MTCSVPWIKISLLFAFIASSVATNLPAPAYSADSDDARLILTERHNATVLKLKHVMTLLECRQEAQPKDLIGRFFLPKTERRGTPVRKAAFAQANAAVPLLEFVQWKISGDWSELGEKERIESLQEARKNLEEAEAHLKLAQTSWFRYEKDVVTTASIRADLVSCVKQKNSEFTTLMEAQESALTTAVEAAGLVEEPKANRPVSLSLPLQAKQPEKKPKEVSRKKKKEQDAVAKKAASVLAQWKTRKGEVPAGFDLMQFSMEADAAFTDDSVDPAEKKKILSDYSQNLARYKKNEAKLKTDPEKISQAIEDLYTDYIHHYEPNNGQVKDLLSGKGGNCDTRSITLFHALAQKLKLNPGPNSRYAAQIFNKHIQLVIYSKDPKTGKEEVWDLLTGKKSGEIKGPLYDPMVMVQGVLMANDQKSPVEFEDFYIAGPKPRPSKEGAKDQGSKLATNSSRAYPSVGVEFGGSTAPNSNSLSPRKHEAIVGLGEMQGGIDPKMLELMVAGKLTQDKYTTIPLDTGVFFNGWDKNETEYEIKTVTLRSGEDMASALEWTEGGRDITFFDPVTFASFVALKTPDERVDFLVNLDIESVRQALASDDNKRVLKYWSDPLRKPPDQADVKSFWTIYYSLKLPSARRGKTLLREKLFQRLEGEGYGERLSQQATLMNRGLDKIEKSPLVYLSKLNQSMRENPGSTQHLGISDVLDQLNAELSISDGRSIFQGRDSPQNVPLRKYESRPGDVVFWKSFLRDEVVFKKNSRISEILKKEKEVPWYLKSKAPNFGPKPPQMAEDSGTASKKGEKIIELDASFMVAAITQPPDMFCVLIASYEGKNEDCRHIPARALRTGDIEKISKKWTPEVSEGLLEFAQFYLKSAEKMDRDELSGMYKVPLLIPRVAATRDPKTLKYPGLKGPIPEDLALLTYGLLSLPGIKNVWGNFGMELEYANRLADALGKPRIKGPK